MAASLLAGRYELHARIGTGGYGEVWRGTDTVLARPIAVKLLQAEQTRYPEAMQRFRAEARLAGALSHPYIAHVYDYCEPDPPDPPFLVMELVDGPSLAEMLSRGPLGVARTLDVLAQAAEGLQAAHQAGVVHRDIKPGNLLVSRDGPVKITDFGISHAASGRVAVSGPVTMVGMVLGTAGYMAPERVAGAPATVASDLYALGVVAHECLTGEGPGTEPPAAPGVAPHGRPLPPLPPEVPADVAALMRRLTSADPAGRPASAGEVARQAAALRDRFGGSDAADTGPRPAAGAAPAAPDTARLGSRGRAVSVTGQDPLPGGAHRSTGPRARAGGWRSRRGMLALAAAGVAGLALLVLGVTEALSQHGPAPVAVLRPSATASGQMVDVTASTLIGRQVGPVRRELHQLGLQVKVIQSPSDAPPGEILGVTPSGDLPGGSVVTLTVAMPGSPGDGTNPGNPSLAPSGSPSPGKAPGQSGSPQPSTDGSPSPSTSASPSGSSSGSPSTSTSSSPSPTTSSSPSPSAS